MQQLSIAPVVADGAMTSGNEVRYARAAGRAIATQVTGSGASTIVVVPDFVSHVELHWQFPAYREFLHGLGELARVVTFDHLGTGLSDPLGVDEVRTIDQRLDDLDSVLGDAGTQQATVIGLSDGGALAMAFAALRPDRVSRLVLVGSYASLDGHPERDRIPELVELVADRWGSGAVLSLLAPSLGAHPHGRAQLAGFERRAAPPATAGRLVRRALDVDVRAMLPLIEQPTLVLARALDRFIGPELSLELVQAMPNAHYLELPGRDHWIGAGDADGVVAAIARFLDAPPPRRRSRAFTVVGFADIANATSQLDAHGDRSWASVLAEYYLAASRIADHFGGRVVKTIGDGILCAFPTPSEAIEGLHALGATARRRGLTTRGGIHAGEVEVLGDGDIAGIAVHLAARVEALAAPGEVWVTDTVRDLVNGSGRVFHDRGTHDLKGVARPHRLFAAGALAG